MSGNFVTGAGYLLRGLAMTFQPGLRRFVLIPLTANVVLFSLMGWLLYEVITDFYDAAMLTVPECCLLYTSPSPRDRSLSRMPSSA